MFNFILKLIEPDPPTAWLMKVESTVVSVVRFMGDSLLGYMRRILSSFLLVLLIGQQCMGAGPVPWKPDFESSSTLPYHVDEKGRTFVLLSKKTYSDPEYDVPAWGDFGGKLKLERQQ